MSSQIWQRLRVQLQGDHSLLDVWYRLEDTAIQLQFGESIERIEAETSEAIIHVTKDAFGESASLLCCVDCLHFEQSGMSREMGTAMRGNCGVHKQRVDLFFHCDHFCSQDSLRPQWDPGEPDLKSAEDSFAQWLKKDQAFVMFQYGTILVEDPGTPSGDYRCRTLLRSLINILPSISVQEFDHFFVVDILGFIYSIVDKQEWAINEARICEAISQDSAFGDAAAKASSPIKIPFDTPHRGIALLAWNRFVKDARKNQLALVHHESL